MRMSSNFNRQGTSWRWDSIINLQCLAITIKSGLLMTLDFHPRVLIKAVWTRPLQVLLQLTISNYLEVQTLLSKKLLISIRGQTTTIHHLRILTNNNQYNSSITHSLTLTQTLLTIKDPLLPSSRQRQIWIKVQTHSLCRAHLPNLGLLLPTMLSHSTLIHTFNSTNSICNNRLKLRFWIKTKQSRFL